MKRSNQRHFKGLLKYLYPLLLFVIISAIAGFWYVNAINKELVVESKEEFFQEYSYDKYYVAVTGYTNSLNDLSFEELKNTEALIDAVEKENVLNLYSSSERSESRSLSSSRLVPRSDNNEIFKEIIKDHSKIAIVPFDKVDFRVKTLAIDGHFLWDKNTTDYPLKIKVTTQNKDEADKEFNPKKVTLLTNVGDVILGRTVAKKMASYNDWTHPWLKTGDLLKNADITFANLETPLSDQVPPPYEGMSFIAPTKSVKGLTLAGIDIVSLANNHSTNFGTSAFNDTLDLLSDNSIKYVGGGKNLEEAENFQIIEKNGVRFAFLNYNSIIGAINATSTTPGVAKFDIKPWAKTDNQQDIEKIKIAIKKAKSEADVVVLGLHWGTEYTPNPIPSQINVAHQSVEAGADLIIGTHPHVVAGMENYKGKPVFYSLGNFIFDQEWSIETKQGVIAQTYFYGNKLVSAPLIPYQIEDYNQPTLQINAGKQILSSIFGASLSSEFKN